MRLVVTLSLAGALAGALLVTVFQATQPAILAHKKKVLEAAVAEVLAQPKRVETLYVVDGALVRQEPGDGGAERVYAGYDASGRRVGFAVPAAEPGFQDKIGLIFGYDPTTRRLLGMKVLESKETPGLGDKIEKDSGFVAQFRDATAPLVGVKRGRSSGNDPAEIDMITGATISSRAVIRIINHALERLGPALNDYTGEQGQ